MAGTKFPSLSESDLSSSSYFASPLIAGTKSPRAPRRDLSPSSYFPSSLRAGTKSDPEMEVDTSVPSGRQQDFRVELCKEVHTLDLAECCKRKTENGHANSDEWVLGVHG